MNLDRNVFEDGTETQYLVQLVSALLTGFSLPAAFALAAKHKLPFFRIFNIGDGNVILAAVLGISYIFDILSYFGHFGVIIFHLTSTADWLKR